MRAFLGISDLRAPHRSTPPDRTFRGDSSRGQSARAYRVDRVRPRPRARGARDRVPAIAGLGGQGWLLVRGELALHERAFLPRAGAVRHADHPCGRSRLGVLRRLGAELRGVRGVQRARAVSPRPRPRSRALCGQDVRRLPRVRTVQKGRRLHALYARDMRGEHGRVLPWGSLPGPRTMPSSPTLFVRTARRDGSGRVGRSELRRGGGSGLSRGVRRRRGMQTYAGRMLRG